MKYATRMGAAGLLAICVAFGVTAEGSKDTAGIAPSASKPTLRFLNLWQKDDYNTYPVAKLLEEKTGYKVQYDMLPQDRAEDKLNLLIASGEAYDIVNTTAGNNFKALIADYGRRGALTEIKPLMDKYGPNLKAVIAQSSFDALMVDGKAYVVPTLAQSFTSTSLMIRKDWLDKLGLKSPETLDEFVAVLRAFKEKDPGNNGDRNIPMTLSAAFVDNIVGAFGIPNEWNEANGNLVHRWDDPALVPYVEFMAKLYAEGLIDKEFPINKTATANEKFSSGRAGVIPLGWYDVPVQFDALAKNVPGAVAVYLKDLKGPRGKSGFAASTGFDRLTFIPKVSKNASHAMIWMNMKLDKDLFRLFTIGEEGKHFTIKDGAYYPILPIFFDERNQANNFLTGSDEKMYPIYWQARVRKDTRLYDAWAYLNKTIPASSRFPNRLGTAPSLTEFSKYNQQLSSKLSDAVIKAIVAGQLTELTQAVVPAIKAEGGDSSTAEVNAWFKTLKAGK